jgi:hypothetical protein
VHIPIACTLRGEAAENRVEEWRRFLSASVTAAERTDSQSLRLRLGPSKDVVGVAVDLAQREKACCAFFEFAIELEADSSWLRVRVPPEAVTALSDFAALVPGTL